MLEVAVTFCGNVAVQLPPGFVGVSVAVVVVVVPPEAWMTSMMQLEPYAHAANRPVVLVLP
ncbi:hypothetical protein [Saccharothrix syringae]|uniref:Uncharacterized protein n=1 Tax=Saccharothrix syringae TaxID=103733 RepID=A0A5Q0H5D7_SACSY|nr:hypothetical protein [Saccharothrix syringae]QFZ21050.1 hypothetical protein EKG83_29985 [Saccharothrix syringae]